MHKDADLQFYAAASLSDAAREICQTWNTRDSLHVTPVLASSSTLARQISQGAPASVFLSANAEWMDYAEQHSDRVIHSCDLLSNRLALIVPMGNPIRLENAAGLRGRALQRLALGDPSHVPAGIYAKAWLEEAGLWNAVKDRLLPAQDVRAALAYVERGEADAGIVYVSDAKAAGFEPLALGDPPRHMPIVYPLAMLAEPDGRDPGEGAHRFYDWLLGPEAREIFAKHGFITLDSRP
ncbi:molybdate ABC transporter substrate-binding protein [bacterium]|nr:molybdate ABC transporter substrate-binding protein [bacterium]